MTLPQRPEETPDRPLLVSAVIPAYNNAQYLAEAIDSALAQTYEPIEVIVVDDGSTDSTPHVLTQYGNRIRAIRQGNQGVSVARNTGISAARGAVIALLDADDTWEKTALTDLVAVLKHAPDIGLVSGVMSLVDAQGAPLGRHHPENIPHPVKKVPLQTLQDSYRLEGPLLETMLKAGTFLVTSSMIIRTSWFNRVGGFVPGLRRAQDRDMWYRLAAAGCPMAFVQKSVGRYRKHRPPGQENLLQFRTTHSRIAPFVNLLANPDLRSKPARKIAKSRIAGFHKSHGDFHLMAARYAEARESYANALRAFPRPIHLAAWFASFLGSAGKALVRKISRDSNAYWQMIAGAIEAEKAETNAKNVYEKALK